MSTYLTPPGAWLSGWDRLSLGGLTPIDKSRARTAAATPIDGNSANTPIDALNQVAATPIDGSKRGLPQPTQPPSPWDGVDPQWVYGGASALLGQALRKSRAKILRPTDDLVSSSDIAKAMTGGRPHRGTHLWRWAPEFRHAQLVGAALGRFQVHGSTLWLLDPKLDQKSLKVSARALVELDQASLPAGIWDDQIDKVLRAAVEREDRLPEILSQAADLWPFFESIVGLRLAAVPRTTELLAVAHSTALHLVMSLKHAVAAPRPLHRSTRVIPLIATPAHGSLPSGHATLATLTAELLGGLLQAAGGPSARLDERREHLDRLARRIAFNRVVAGVHFPIDSVAGYSLGRLLGSVFMALAGDKSTRLRPLSKDDVWLPGEGRYALAELRPVPTGAVQPSTDHPTLSWPRVLTPLDTLWNAALAELRDAAA